MTVKKWEPVKMPDATPEQFFALMEVLGGDQCQYSSQFKAGLRAQYLKKLREIPWPAL